CIRLLTSAATQFLERRLGCIGAIEARKACGSGFGELPGADSVSDIGGYVLPGNWRGQIGCGLNNIRRVRSAEEEERHRSIRIKNHVCDHCGSRRKRQLEDGADGTGATAECCAIQ